MLVTLNLGTSLLVLLSYNSFKASYLVFNVIYLLVAIVKQNFKYILFFIVATFKYKNIRISNFMSHLSWFLHDATITELLKFVLDGKTFCLQKPIFVICFYQKFDLYDKKMSKGTKNLFDLHDFPNCRSSKCSSFLRFSKGNKKLDRFRWSFELSVGITLTFCLSV